MGREDAQLLLAAIALIGFLLLRVRRVLGEGVGLASGHLKLLLYIFLIIALLYSFAMVWRLRPFRLDNLRVRKVGNCLLLEGKGRRFLFLPLRLRPVEGAEPLDMEEVSRVLSGMGLSVALLSVSRIRTFDLLGFTLRGERSNLILLFTRAEEVSEALRAVDGGRRALSGMLKGYRLKEDPRRDLAWLCLAAMSAGSAQEGAARVLPLIPDQGGKISLGEDRWGEKVALREEELMNHVVILGQTGSGKTTTCKRILRSLDCSYLVIDPHGEYSEGEVHRIGVDSGIGLLNLKGASDEEIREIAEVFADALELSHPQYSFLIRALEREREGKEEPGMISLIRRVEQMPARGPEYEVKAALLRRLSPLGTEEVDVAFRGEMSVDSLFEGRHVIRLNLLRSQEAKRVFTYALLRRIYRKAMLRGRSDGLRMVILIDEGDRIIPSGRGLEVVEDIFSELRKFGVGALITASDPSLLPPRIFGNAAVKIVHSISSPEGVLLLSRIIKSISTLRELEPGEAILIRRGDPREVLVRVKTVN